MKELLFLLDYYSPHRWGIENVFENIIFRLTQKNYHITLITSHFDPNLPKEEHHHNLTIHRVGNGRKSFFFQSFRKGAKILRRHKHIEIIHSSTYTSAIPASLLGTLFKKKKILTVHEIFWKLRKQFKPRYSRRMYQLFERLSFALKHDEYHCVSLYTLNSLRIHYGLPDQKLHLIYNGVDTDFRNPSYQQGVVTPCIKTTPCPWTQRRKKFWRENKFLMLYYGHSGISKGIDYLVEAIPEIVKQNPDGILIFNLIPAKRDRFIRERIMDTCWQPLRPTGTSPDREENYMGNITESVKFTPLSGGEGGGRTEQPVPHKLRESGSEDDGRGGCIQEGVVTPHLCLFSWFPQPQLRELIACVDLVIAPSLAEGFGSVHSEACAMGKTLLTTQVAAIPEVVSGKVKFVQAGSSEAIVQGIKEIRAGKVEEIAKKHFNRDETVEKLEQLYTISTSWISRLESRVS